MVLTIPNDVIGGTAQEHAQSAPDSGDIAVIAAGIGGNGVYIGGAVTAQGSPDMTVAVAAGLGRYNEKSFVIAAGNVTITTADATNPRFDLIVVSNTGSKSCTAGTAAAVPVWPAIPANSIVLAEVYVPASDTAIGSNQITDKRCIIPSSLPVVVYKAADEIVNNSTAFQDDDDLKFDVDANSIWIVEYNLLTLCSNNAADMKFQFTGPSGFTIDWAPIVNGNLNPMTSITPYWVAVGNVGAAALLSSASTLVHGVNNLRAGLILRLMLFNSSTAGTLTLQWAQNSAQVADSKMLKGSNVIARRLGV